jgi:hypothetical protein
MQRLALAVGLVAIPDNVPPIESLSSEALWNVWRV